MFSIKKLREYQPYVCVPNVFSPDEVKAIRSILEGRELSQAMIGDKKAIVHLDLRSSKIARISADEQEHQWIFETLAGVVDFVNTRAFGLDLHYIESLQLTEYDSSYTGFYGQHMDASYGSGSLMNDRKLSITVQLSSPEEYEGGELMLYPNNLTSPDVSPKDLGSATLFRSQIIHEVKPVTSGKRYSLVAWVKGPLLR